MASEKSYKKRKISDDVDGGGGGGLLESLPGDILADIFSRLPISSIARLMFVSRSWRSILTQHGRISSSSSSPTKPCLLLHCDFPIRNGLHFLDLSEEEKRIKTKKFTLRFAASMPEFDVVGSCNGLLCLSDSLYNDSLYLYNPFTTNSLELPQCSNKYHDQELVFGFGFHETAKEYKVVKIVYFRGTSSSNNGIYKARGRIQYKQSEVQVLTLSSRTDQSLSWRSLGKAPYKFMKRSSEALVNGRLHFVTRPRRHVPDRKFVSFDLEDEEFREIPKPDCGGLNRTNHRLVNLKGCLCAVVYGNYSKLDIWVMKSYGVKESWGKEYSIGTYLPKGLKQNPDRPMWIWKNAENGKVVRVLCLLENGEILLEYKSRVLAFHKHRHRRHRGHRRGEEFEYSAISCRAYSASLDEFGAVGDGVTLNTAAFRDAVSQLSRFADYGGSLLFVPAGRWLTGSFNLTSHFTLFLHRDAVILASQEESDYEVIEPLPSYGRGRDTDGGRFISLLFGSNLTDVVITGENGTIDGQGEPWWGKFKRGELKYTRPYLVEIMHSDGIQISNLTFLNSPSWHIHPVYSSNIFIQGLTILAPVTVPNTDGINPDSCTNTRIEDCYIVSGDDCIAVKSGWDQYGIAYGMPTKQLLIRRLTCISPDSAVIALGSEMSGGIEDVRAEDIVAINSESAIRIKTAIGRGGYVKDVYVRGMTMSTMKYVFWMTGSYGSHPDEHYDPKALPVIQNINYQDMVAENVTMPAQLAGISGDQFTGICISNVTITLSKKPKKVLWNCTDVSGYTSGVTPQPCQLLPEKQPGTIVPCNFPENPIPIDEVKLQRCYSRRRN